MHMKMLAGWILAAIFGLSLLFSNPPVPLTSPRPCKRQPDVGRRRIFACVRVPMGCARNGRKSACVRWNGKSWPCFIYTIASTGTPRGSRTMAFSRPYAHASTKAMPSTAFPPCRIALNRVKMTMTGEGGVMSATAFACRR